MVIASSPTKQTLPLNVTELEQAVRTYLQQSSLAVHLLSSRYGTVPEDEQRSIPHLQLDLAAERCGQANFVRLVWLPPGLQLIDERQQRLLDTIQKTSPSGSELVQTKLEDLKSHIHLKLPPPPLPAATNGHRELIPPKVYLLYDEQDSNDSKTLDDFLHDCGYEVLQPPLGSDDQHSLQQYHLDNLKLCDAVLIYHGQASQLWAQVKLQDLLKLQGLGRSQPLLAKALYLAAPPHEQKERLRSREVLIIKGYDGFKAEILEPFLSRLKNGPRVGS